MNVAINDLDQSETKQSEIMEELIETQELYEETVQAQKKLKEVCNAYDTRYDEMKNSYDSLVSKHDDLNSSHIALKYKCRALEKTAETRKTNTSQQTTFNVNKLIGKWRDRTWLLYIITLRPCCKNVFNVADVNHIVQYTLSYEDNRLYLRDGDLSTYDNVNWYCDTEFQYMSCSMGILKKVL